MSRRGKKNLCPPGYIVEKVSSIVSTDKNDKNVKERARRRVDALWWETLSVLMKNEREYHGKARAQLLKDVIIRMYNLERENRELKRVITEDLHGTPPAPETFQLASYDKIIEWYLKISEKGQSRAACDPQFWHESLIEFFSYGVASCETKEVNTKLEIDHENRKVIERTTLNEFKEADMKYDDLFPTWRPGESIPDSMIEILFEPRSKSIAYGASDFEIYANCPSIHRDSKRGRGRGRGRGRTRRPAKRKPETEEDDPFASSFPGSVSNKRRKNTLADDGLRPPQFDHAAQFSLPSPQLSFVPQMYNGSMAIPPAISIPGYGQAQPGSRQGLPPMPHSAPSSGFTMHPFPGIPPPVATAARVHSQPGTPNTWVPPASAGPDGNPTFMEMMLSVGQIPHPGGAPPTCTPDRMKLRGGNVFGSPNRDCTLSGDTVTTTESGSGSSEEGHRAGSNSGAVHVTAVSSVAAAAASTLPVVVPAMQVDHGSSGVSSSDNSSKKVIKRDAIIGSLPNFGNYFQSTYGDALINQSAAAGEFTDENGYDFQQGNSHDSSSFHSGF